MSWFGKLFGTEKAIDSLLDKDKGLLVRAGGWIDGLHHTEQEKAEDQLLVKRWGIKQLEALEPFKVVQRVIAFAVLSLWWIVGVNILVALWVEALNPEIKVYDSMMELATSDYVFWPVLSVLSLYMCGGVWPKGKP